MFKVASVSDVRSIEQLCFERGISQDELMGKCRPWGGPKDH